MSNGHAHGPCLDPFRETTPHAMHMRAKTRMTPASHGILILFGSLKYLDKQSANLLNVGYATQPHNHGTNIMIISCAFEPDSKSTYNSPIISLLVLF